MATYAKTALAYLAAVATTYVLAALASTQSVLDNVRELGLPVPPGERLAASLHDLAGMSTSFLPLIALALLAGFVAAGALARRYAGLRWWLYVLAGACAMWVLHAALKLAFDITPVAAARSVAGLVVQAGAGAAGGALFAALKRPAGQPA